MLSLVAPAPMSRRTMKHLQRLTTQRLHVERLDAMEEVGTRIVSIIDRKTGEVMLCLHPDVWDSIKDS